MDPPNLVTKFGAQFDAHHFIPCLHNFAFVDRLYIVLSPFTTPIAASQDVLPLNEMTPGDPNSRHKAWTL
jgi:hypothetical protein